MEKFCWCVVVEAHRRCTRLLSFWSGDWKLLSDKFALTRNPLLNLGIPLDSIFRFAVALRHALGNDVATTRPDSIESGGCKRNSLANSELVLCHYTAFRFCALVLPRL